MYTIFENQRVIILADSTQKFTSEFKVYPYDMMRKDQLAEMALGAENKRVAIISNDLKTLWEDFANGFEIIEAAGGLVRNEAGDLLWIIRHEMYDLPKGKIETDESIKEAAVREVQEECGIKDLHLTRFLSKSYHLYEYRGKNILKITHWFEMSSQQKELSPQEEEGISQVLWRSEEESRRIATTTYPNIQLLLDGYW